MFVTHKKLPPTTGCVIVAFVLQPDVIGIDLGGTKCALGRFDGSSWKILESETIPTRAGEGFAAVIDDMTKIIEKMRTPQTTAIGIGVPGLIRQPEGILMKAPNIAHSADIDVKNILSEKTGLPVSVGNDAQCFVLAEALMGSAKNHKVVVGITFGTGVGGGIVIDGKIFGGAHGYAGEIGHMLLMPGQPPYKTKDMRGEVEQFLSGTAMGKRCEEAHSPEDYLNGAVCSFMQPDIYREVAWLCTNLIHLVDPDVIVFGGSAGHALHQHIDEITAELKKWTLPNTPLPKIVAGSTREKAGMLGAALLTR
jgi:predicted NBD/HSP70 family sugar kinase